MNSLSSKIKHRERKYSMSIIIEDMCYCLNIFEYE